MWYIVPTAVSYAALSYFFFKHRIILHHERESCECATLCWYSVGAGVSQCVFCSLFQFIIVMVNNCVCGGCTNSSLSGHDAVQHMEYQSKKRVRLSHSSFIGSRPAYGSAASGKHDGPGSVREAIPRKWQLFGKNFTAGLHRRTREQIHQQQTDCY